MVLFLRAVVVLLCFGLLSLSPAFPNEGDNGGDRGGGPRCTIEIDGIEVEITVRDVCRPVVEASCGSSCDAYVEQQCGDILADAINCGDDLAECQNDCSCGDCNPPAAAACICGPGPVNCQKLKKRSKWVTKKDGTQTDHITEHLRNCSFSIVRQ